MVLKIRNLEIDTPLALAPMVGLSHSALRSLVIELGGVGLLFTEMLSAKRLPSENMSSSPFLARGAEENPLIYQVYMSHEHDLPGVLDRLHELDAQGIDINLGCPAPQLRKIGAGQELLKNRAVAISLIKKLRQQTDLPLSVKIRLGAAGDSQKLTDTCQLFEDLGVDYITIHARHDTEKFCRKPRWTALETVTRQISIPVIANGGIFTVEDARQCLEQSGAAGLMIGRGAAYQPWLLRSIAEELYQFKPDSCLPDGQEIYERFVVLLRDRFRPERRLGRLKQFTHYYGSNYAFGHLLVSRIQNSHSLDQAVEIATDFFDNAA